MGNWPHNPYKPIVIALKCEPHYCFPVTMVNNTYINDWLLNNKGIINIFMCIDWYKLYESFLIFLLLVSHPILNYLEFNIIEYLVRLVMKVRIYLAIQILYFNVVRVITRNEQLLEIKSIKTACLHSMHEAKQRTKKEIRSINKHWLRRP